MEIPSKIRLCCEEWLPDSGLVTAALKLRRKNIQDFYQMEINKMYGTQDSKST
jgi:long-chain acyl-CoA synthetase